MLNKNFYVMIYSILYTTNYYHVTFDYIFIYKHARQQTISSYYLGFYIQYKVTWYITVSINMSYSLLYIRLNVFEYFFLVCNSIHQNVIFSAIHKVKYICKDAIYTFCMQYNNVYTTWMLCQIIACHAIYPMLYTICFTPYLFLLYSRVPQNFLDC